MVWSYRYVVCTWRLFSGKLSTRMACAGIGRRRKQSLCRGYYNDAGRSGILADWYGFNNRTDVESVFKRGLFSNRYINIGIVVEVILLLALIYIPFFNGIFNTAPISLIEWLYLICIPFIVFGIEELRKAFLRKKRKEQSK